MSISSLYRKILGLVAGCTLFVTGLPLSAIPSQLEDKLSTTSPAEPDQEVGCSYLKPMSDAEKVQQLPSIALNVHSHNYEFNWETMEVNGVPLRKILPQAKFWRLQVFQFSDGTRIGGNSSDYRSFDSEEQRRETLFNLPFDTLLRVDIDLKNTPGADEPDEDAKTVSFMVLLHDE